MSREVRLHEPVKIVYTEYHPKRSDNELDEVELKAKQVSTFEEAAWLEHEILTKWAQRVQGGGYVALPWSPDFGSPTMQLLAKLYALTMKADEVISHEKPILPKEEREKIDLPEVISAPWLAQYLGKLLGLPVEQVIEDSAWHQPNVRWVPDDVKDLQATFGKTAGGEVLMCMSALAKKCYDSMPNDSVLAIGCKPVDERIGIFFKMKRADVKQEQEAVNRIYQHSVLIRKINALVAAADPNELEKEEELRQQAEDLWLQMTQLERDICNQDYRKHSE